MVTSAAGAFQTRRQESAYRIFDIRRHEEPYNQARDCHRKKKALFDGIMGISEVLCSVSCPTREFRLRLTEHRGAMVAASLLLNQESTGEADIIPVFAIRHLHCQLDSLDVD